MRWRKTSVLTWMLATPQYCHCGVLAVLELTPDVHVPFTNSRATVCKYSPECSSLKLALNTSSSNCQSPHGLLTLELNRRLCYWNLHEP